MLGLQSLGNTYPAFLGRCQNAAIPRQRHDQYEPYCLCLTPLTGTTAISSESTLGLPATVNMYHRAKCR